MIQKIYKFSAKWCAPCNSFAPIFDSVMKKYDGKFEVCKVDVDNCTDEESEIMRENKILSIPTTLIIDENNDVAQKLLGVYTEKDLTDIIEKEMKT